MARISKLQARRGTAAAWASANPTLEAGEFGFETDTNTLKVGTGVDAYNTLSPVASYMEEMPFGIEWDTSLDTPSLRRIDLNGNDINLPPSFFDSHKIWGSMKRCVISAAGAITYGRNPRGDGLTLDGSAGNVMVSIPKFYYKYAWVGNLFRLFLSKNNLTGFSVFPAFLQRGGTEQDFIYVSAYECSGILEGELFKLVSATGKQPVTGEVSYPDLPGGSFTIDNAESYANNIGSGFGCMNIWTLTAITLLFAVEYASFNSQTVLGRGVVDMAYVSGYDGVFTGIDSVDTNIGINGTGKGTGTDGLTPIAYRGLENLWGGVWHFIIGVTIYDVAYRILRRDGLGTCTGHVPVGSYEESTATPITGYGFISGIEREDLLSCLLFGKTLTGSSSTYLCDQQYSHDPTKFNIMLHGGAWSYTSNAGLFLKYFYGPETKSGRNDGARMEYIPQ